MCMSNTVGGARESLLSPLISCGLLMKVGVPSVKLLQEWQKEAKEKVPQVWRQKRALFSLMAPSGRDTERAVSIVSGLW